MYRLFLSMSFVAALTLAGCGGSSTEESKNTENKTGNSGSKESGSTGSGSKGSGSAGSGSKESGSTGGGASASAGTKAQIGIEVDFAKLMENPAFADSLEQQKQIPAFAKEMKSLTAYVSLPDSFSPTPEGINFIASLTFETEGAAAAAMEEIKKNSPQAESMEKGGNTYTVMKDADGMDAYLIQTGPTVTASSSDYAGASDVATPALKSILSGLSAPYRMGVDMESMKGFLGGAVAMIPAQDDMTKNIIDTVMKLKAVKSTAMDDNYFMLAFDAPDEESAKALRQYLTQGVAALAAFGGAMGPDEKEAPAMAEMFSHVMGSLGPKKSGNTVAITITKPDNHAELEKKMGEEMKKIADTGQSPFGGLPLGPGGGFPEKK